MRIPQISQLNPSSTSTDQHVDMSNSQPPSMFLDFTHGSQIEPSTVSTVDNSLASHHSFEFPTDQMPLNQISSNLVEGQNNINIDRGYTDQIKFNEDTPFGIEGISNGGSYNIDSTMDEFANGPITSSCSSSTTVRKKTKTQWSGDEHKLFLLGLRKYGKGDWKSISRNYVITKSSTQVASHAQKYYKRHDQSTARRKRASIHDIVNVDDDSIVALVGKGLLSHDKALSHIGQHFDEANIASNTRLESYIGQQHCVHFHPQFDEANLASNTRLESHVGQQHCVQFGQQHYVQLHQQIDEFNNIALNTRLESHVGQQDCVQFHQQIDEANLASNTLLESHDGQQHCVQFHQQIDEANIALNTRLESHVRQQHCVQFHQQIDDEASLASNTRLSHVGQQHYLQFHQQIDESNIAGQQEVDEIMPQSYQDYGGTNTSSSSSFQTQSPWDPLHQLQ
ncbi:uncharacterized protein LOC141595965 [Silene latifolia]|uniref:uncharacterized protein LOC141595965 n=1 Tax=Silene latifolia TaxID=37657 RepID=UPI003D772EBD